jgi:hypothetical protein
VGDVASHAQNVLVNIVHPDLAKLASHAVNRLVCISFGKGHTSPVEVADQTPAHVFILLSGPLTVGIEGLQKLIETLFG